MRKIVAVIAASVLSLSTGVAVTLASAPTAQAHPGYQLIDIDWYQACDQQGGQDPHPGWGAETRCWGWNGEFTANAFAYCGWNYQTIAVYAFERWYCG